MQETKKDMREIVLKLDTILDRNVLRAQEIINARNVGKPLGRRCFSTGEIRSEISKSSNVTYTTAEENTTDCQRL